MNQQNVLSVKKLNKIYFKNTSKSVHALKNLNLEVKEGEIFGLLGPNGAGKSTFINILAGTTIKTSGNVNVWGFNLDKNPRQVRASIGIVPQEVNVDPFFSPRKLLELQAGLYGIKKKDRIVAYMPNCIETVEGFIATAAIGAIWSSCSPDFGINGVVERFLQIKPKILFITD